MLGGGGQDTLAWNGGRVSLPPPPIPSQICGPHNVVKKKMLKTHKNLRFSEHLITVLPVYDVFMVKTVYVWVGAKIPRLKYPSQDILAPAPYSSQKVDYFFLLENT